MNIAINYDDVKKNNEIFIQENYEKLNEYYDMEYNNEEEYDKIINILEASLSDTS
jgi:hypothetical protein